MLHPLWLLQALQEAWSDNINPEYAPVTAVVIPTVILLILVPTLMNIQVRPLWQITLAVIGIYVIFGVIYAIVRRKIR